MKTLIISLTMLVVAFLLTAWGISAYLGVDDLRGCGQRPSATADTSAKCRSAGAIVAISGGDTSGRAKEAIELFRFGWGKYLIFSGGAADKSGPSNAEVMKRQAIDAGVDPKMIIVEGQSTNTAENAAETKHILDSMGISTVILVTSRYHERRAMLEFRKEAPKVTFRARPTYYDKQWSGWWWLTPNGWVVAVPEVVRSLTLEAEGAK